MSRPSHSAKSLIRVTQPSRLSESFIRVVLFDSPPPESLPHARHAQCAPSRVGQRTHTHTQGCSSRHLIADNLGWHPDWREAGFRCPE